MRVLSNLFRGAIAVFALSSCGGDAGTPPSDPLVATSLTANSSTSISAVAGTAVSALPSVIVKDQNGAVMPGVSVIFAVTSGGGTVTGGSATSDGAGVATVGSWTLGTTAGPNSLTATTTGVPVLTFSATGTAGTLASLTKTAGDAQSGVAGSPVSIRPAVTVKDANGNPVSNITVLFAVVTGGGAVTGGSATSNAAGVATVGSWTLGATIGPNTLTATATGVAAVTFSATGTAGPPTSMTKTAGDNQSWVVGSPVSIPPAVTLKDANNNPVSNVTVLFTVDSGGGTVTGGSATSNAAGVATVGSWTLGATALGGGGVNALRASAAGVSSVTFLADAACPVQNHAFGTTTTGSLAVSDCFLYPAVPTYIDFHVTTTTTNAFLFSESSGDFDTYLYLLANDSTLIAENDDYSGFNSGIKVLLPAGTYLPVASSFAFGVVGSYSLSSAVTSPDIANCEEVYAVPGITTTQNITASDCIDDSGTYYADLIGMHLEAGQSVNISEASGAFDTYLELYDLGFTLLASNDDADGTTNSRILFTASESGYYIIVARGLLPSTFGPYTLTIQ